MEQKWISLAEAARYTGLSIVTMRRAVRQGRVRAVRVNGARVWRTTRGWCDEYLSSAGACARHVSFRVLADGGDE
jgi:excisionase family DNA binding protein